MDERAAQEIVVAALTADTTAVSIVVGDAEEDLVDAGGGDEESASESDGGDLAAAGDAVGRAAADVEQSAGPLSTVMVADVSVVFMGCSYGFQDIGTQPWHCHPPKPVTLGDADA